MKKWIAMFGICAMCMGSISQAAEITSVSGNDVPAEDVTTPAGEQPETAEDPSQTDGGQPETADDPSQTDGEQPETAEDPSQTDEEQSAETDDTINIPDFTLQNYEDIKEQIAQITQVNWIISYEFSEDVPEDIIISQDVAGEIAWSEDLCVNLVVSLGKEAAVPTIPEEEGDDFLSFYGLEDLVKSPGFGVGNFETWKNMPCTYEFNWDNSESCWQWGMWYDGEKYTTPRGEYDSNVRHQMSLYCDGSYVYLYIKFARVYDPGFNGEDYRFFIDGQMAAFQLTYQDGSYVTNNTKNKAPGMYELSVKHRSGWQSPTVAAGTSAYLYISPEGYNNELEIAIPMITLQEQNPQISLENVRKIEFFNPNLMYRNIESGGADTAPFVWATMALILVPLGTTFVYGYRRKKKA